jgi:hypothetical protein
MTVDSTELHNDIDTQRLKYSLACRRFQQLTKVIHAVSLLQALSGVQKASDPPTRPKTASFLAAFSIQSWHESEILFPSSHILLIVVFEFESSFGWLTKYFFF